LEEKEEDGLYIFKPPAQGHFQIAADTAAEGFFIFSSALRQLFLMVGEAGFEPATFGC
jgi:hypothetical protein